LGAKPQSSSTTEKKMTLAIKGMRRPYRSASIPNSTAPSGRMAKVAVMVQTMAPLETTK